MKVLRIKVLRESWKYFHEGVKMSEYRFFATVYDRMMSDIPYDDWEQYILQLLYMGGVPPQACITELGCGTGIMTRKLAEAGFRMTGIDLSLDMLRVAGKSEADERVFLPDKSEEGSGAVRYLCMDMRDFSVDQKQDAIISIADSVNYLLTEEDMYRMMKSVYINLKPGGIFIFDLKTEYLYKQFMHGRTFRENMGDFSYVWKNRYDDELHIHHYYLWFKYKKKGDIGRWHTAREHHRQRVFGAEDIKQAAKQAGFRRAWVYDAFTFDKPRKNSERIYVVLRKDNE